MTLERTTLTPARAVSTLNFTRGSSLHIPVQYSYKATGDFSIYRSGEAYIVDSESSSTGEALVTPIAGILSKLGWRDS